MPEWNGNQGEDNEPSRHTVQLEPGEEILRKLTPDQLQQLAKKLYALLRDDLRSERERVAGGGHSPR